MRVLISADMEGVGGVAHWDDVTIGKPDYERFRRLMTAEVNAVINGVLETEPGASVRVADAHGQFRNILVEDLDPRVTLIRGRPRAMSMMDGVQDGADAVLFVGYHARSGAGPAVLSHTMNGANLDVRVNGRSVGEIGVNAMLAGRIGAPVVFCSGDDAACAEFTDVVPGGIAVEVKRAVGQASAETVHPKVINSRLREGAARAVARRASIAPVAADGPIELEMDVHRPYIVDLAVLIPGVSRVGGRTVRFETDSYEEAYRVMMLVTTVASVPV
ncbi:M55 family metallopeptidase [Phytomonospora endophytica]|uniref:D-amino peptidase n=1 Tax=Phytomonospora endophytica TaxID=714109 RepID=A0A841G1L5_9ACTN|nr:M55 family metallopeptidase [Phytomonospora endophytica]MBB6039818.1 D-amino peptidase [Phytomonospora endophytica]GIG70328.1 transporter [Phytomonospora endophytica]